MDLMEYQGGVLTDLSDTLSKLDKTLKADEFSVHKAKRLLKKARKEWRRIDDLNCFLWRFIPHELNEEIDREFTTLIPPELEAEIDRACDGEEGLDIDQKLNELDRVIDRKFGIA